MLVGHTNRSSPFPSAPSCSCSLPIREGRDDEALGAAHELVLVVEGDVGEDDVCLVHVLTEVDSALTQPIEIRHRPHIPPTLPKFGYAIIYTDGRCIMVHTLLRSLSCKINHATNQTIKNVPLMDMDGDQRFVFGPLYRFQVTRRLINEKIEKIQETIIHLGHDPAVGARLRQRGLRVSRPDHLQPQDAHLQQGQNAI